MESTENSHPSPFPPTSLLLYRHSIFYLQGQLLPRPVPSSGVKSGLQTQTLLLSGCWGPDAHLGCPVLLEAGPSWQGGPSTCRGGQKGNSKPGPRGGWLPECWQSRELMQVWSRPCLISLSIQASFSWPRLRIFFFSLGISQSWVSPFAFQFLIVSWLILPSRLAWKFLIGCWALNEFLSAATCWVTVRVTPHWLLAAF